MRSLWTDLLFLHGHIASLELARQLAATPPPQDKPSGQRERTGQPLNVNPVAHAITQITSCGKACAPT